MNAEVRESNTFTQKDSRTGGLIEEYLCYLSEKKNRSASTLDSYKNDLDQFTAFLAELASAGSCGPDSRILNINADSTRRFIDFLNGQYTPSTLNRKITAVRGLYSYLISTARLSANPFARLRIRPVEPTSIEYLEEAHLQQLFDAISGSHWLASRDRAIIAILYSTGMRVGELLGLCADDIDLDNKTMQIRTAGRATRLCHLAAWAWHTVERYMSRRPLSYITDPSQNDVLFINRNGDGLSARSIRRKLTEYSRRANLPVETTPAILRHSCAIHMLRRGADVKAVRNLLGHLSASSIRPYLNYLSEEPNQPAVLSEPVEIAVS
ncbi:MAG: tyrosine-type recombinase/integrase [Phycisphaerae bacterium]|nr:tyrosine-type recombinase/integrase [Phycisphaerae bacterium]